MWAILVGFGPELPGISSYYSLEFYRICEYKIICMKRKQYIYLLITIKCYLNSDKFLLTHW